MLPHRLVPRRVVPRAWWHTTLGRGLPVSGGADTIETHLSDVLGRRMRVVVHVRPARRANRKPILEAYDESGLAGFVKIGDSPRARRLVRYESEVLRMLAGQPLKVVVPPDVLYHGRWRGLEVLMLSPLPVTSLRVGSRRVPARLLTSAAREIAAIRPYDEEAGSEERTGETAAWHGDFTPGTSPRVRTGGCSCGTGSGSPWVCRPASTPCTTSSTGRCAGCRPRSPPAPVSPRQAGSSNRSASTWPRHAVRRPTTWSRWPSGTAATARSRSGRPPSG
ncbi:hypothetical protein GCM10027612_82540 [Microbispora bryophytorum subsp. camponoti]